MEQEKRGLIYWGLKRMLYIITSISPVLATRIIYLYHCKKILHLNPPVLFNEKINYLKLYDYPKNKLVEVCADKIKVREYVKSKGLQEILIPIIGTFKNADDINWKKLPTKFVMKCNHASGFNIICNDINKIDEKKTKNTINKWLKIDYGKYTTEIHYSNIKPQLLIEENLASKDQEIVDYKIFCFDGEPKYIEVVTGRDKEKTYYDYYDLLWNKCAFTNNHYASSHAISKPKKLNKMIKIAKKLSSDFKFVRVDLYNINGKIYFGELTFTPSGGCCKKFTEYGNKTLGKLITIEQ